ncbi:MAG: ShlB/FhaC/HecB family hemolysin secretion/activation protein [Cyanobacteria bacterium SBLK]|nr:ShlB/FhaC/HecB family hemolysin secretion/activation protein [Cyanobacteria bacterium SBLK]
MSAKTGMVGLIFLTIPFPAWGQSNAGDRNENVLPSLDSDPPVPIPESPPDSVLPSNDDLLETNCPDPSDNESVQEPIFSSSLKPTFPIETIHTTGNTIFDSEIEEILQPYENNEITWETLNCLADRITEHYVEKGYRTTGAFIPAQEVSNGSVKIEVVEGELKDEDISIEGLTHLQEAYVRSRLQRSSQKPLRVSTLDDTLQLLAQKPFIENIEPVLNPLGDGRSSLSVKITEAPRFRPSVSFDNYHSPSTGAVEANFIGQYDNLWGWGDRLSAGYGRSQGSNTYRLGYSIPINPLDSTLSLRYARGDSRILEEGLRDFGIRGQEELFSFGFRQPLYQTANREFALGVTFDLRRSQTFLFDDIPFSFARGAERGESKVSVLRFSQEWIDRQVDRGFVFRSQFSFGLDAFGATVNDSGTDGRFFSWQGDFIWRQRFSSRVSTIARLSAQLTPDSLLSLERFSLGGTNNLKGYRPGFSSGDNGIWGSLEARISLTPDPEDLQIIPSIAIGTVWNNDTPNPDPSTFASLGLGLRWQIVDNLFVHLDYGIPLVTLDNRGSSLQDRGLFFALRYEF